MTVNPSLIICPENYGWLARFIMGLAYRRRIPRSLGRVAFWFVRAKRKR